MLKWLKVATPRPRSFRLCESRCKCSFIPSARRIPHLFLFPMITLFRSIWIWTACAVLIVLWTPLLAAVRLFDRQPDRIRTGLWFQRLGRALTRVYPCRIEISGREHLDPAQSYIVVSNHQSIADIPVITHLRLETKWVAKAELFPLPFVGWMLRMAGEIPVDRSDSRKRAKALMQCVRYLRHRCSIVFFPEGTRSRDGEVLPFNEGPFQLALREQIPVLPLVVCGSGAALPRNSWLFGETRDVYLRVLEPVQVEGRNVKESAALRDEVRQSIVDELARLRNVG